MTFTTTWRGSELGPDSPVWVLADHDRPVRTTLRELVPARVNAHLPQFMALFSDRPGCTLERVYPDTHSGLCALRTLLENEIAYHRSRLLVVTQYLADLPEPPAALN